MTDKNLSASQAPEISGEDSESDRAAIAPLLKEAYPHPSKSIRDSVMAQIAKEKKARKRAKIVRFTSIAACCVIAVGAVLASVPYFNTLTADYSASSDTAEAEEAAEAEEYDEDSTTEEAPVMSTFMARSSSNEAASEAEDSAAEEDATEQFDLGTSLTEDYSDSEAESEVQEDELLTMFSAPAAGSSASDNSNSYDASDTDINAIKQALVDYVGMEKYSAWASEKGYASYSDWTTEEFARAFSISASELDSITASALN